MYEAQDVLEAARAIRPHLSELVPPDAEDVDNRLGRLIQRAEGGQDVKLEILELLSERETTRDWADKLLEVPAVAAYESAVTDIQCCRGEGGGRLAGRSGWPVSGVAGALGNLSGILEPGHPTPHRDSEISRLGHAEGAADLTVSLLSRGEQLHYSVIIYWHKAVCHMHWISDTEGCQ